LASRLSSRPVRVAILYFVWDLFRDPISDFVDGLVKVVGLVAEALVEMRPRVVAQFNERTRVNPDVKYFTLAGQCAVPTPSFA